MSARSSNCNEPELLFPSPPLIPNGKPDCNVTIPPTSQLPKVCSDKLILIAQRRSRVDEVGDPNKGNVFGRDAPVVTQVKRIRKLIGPEGNISRRRGVYGFRPGEVGLELQSVV